MEKKAIRDMERKTIDLRSRIEARAVGNEKHKGKEKALNVLDYVKLLGGVVAQAASTVFGPSELYFSAISVLLDVPRKLQEFDDIIDSVFVSIEPILSQFKIYSDIEQFKSMDDELIATHKVLIGLVTICTRVVNLEKTEGELEKFEALIKNQQIVVGSVVLETVLRNRGDLAKLLTLAGESKLLLSDVKTGVMSLMEAESSRRPDENRKERLEKIQDSPGTLSSTGKWFTAIPAFNDWADCDKRGTGPLLLLTGDSSSGKSFSTSAIIRHLALASSLSKQTRRCLIGHHFFTSHSKRVDEDNKQAETALKWIALQLAEQDESYAKHLADGLGRDKNEQFFKKADIQTLWEILRLGAPLAKNYTQHSI
ncbi:hypothetical protein QBC38DRAFT_450527 [Podospora fimiseda]|uniref:Fungal STAND N-terminal Goodbye domain-containing protein n=1 Tax=Podospora fimiseda TaxID=252190 RepID=A0AAN7H8F9_9PEZI|nr:hypothetical protein QBC38DRAFT_450527 [Podospora fimiseda]